MLTAPFLIQLQPGTGILLPPGLARADAAVWEVNQQTKDLSLFLPLCDSAFQINQILKKPWNNPASADLIFVTDA